MSNYIDYMANFSQSDLRGYLGEDMVDLLVEWMPNGDTLLTKQRMVTFDDTQSPSTSHKFYTSFLSKIYSNAEVKTTFELFLASLIQSVRKTDPYQAVQNDRLMTTWYNRLNNYIAEQLNPRDMK